MVQKKFLTARQMQALDRTAIERYGIPSLALMENAGAAVAREVRRMLKRKRGRRATIVCGTGNNGGDGFVAARHLVNAGVKARVFVIGTAARMKGDAALHYAVLKRCGFPVRVCRRADAALCRALGSCDVIVDALFGVGLNRALEEPFIDVIAAINASGRPVVAVDVPSGLDATSGVVQGAAVRAVVTVTFGFPKTGFRRREGARLAGRVKVADIGLPANLARRVRDDG